MKKQNEISQNTVKLGIINMDSLLDMLMSKKKDIILKMHPYAITPPSTANGRWQTCYKDEKGRAKISRHNQKRNYWIS